MSSRTRVGYLENSSVGDPNPNPNPNPKGSERFEGSEFEFYIVKHVLKGKIQL